MGPRASIFDDQRTHRRMFRGCTGRVEVGVVDDSRLVLGSMDRAAHRDRDHAGGT